MKIMMNEGVSSSMDGYSRGIIEEGSELQVQVMGLVLAICVADERNSQILTISYDSYGESSHVYISNCIDGGRSPRGIRPFEYVKEVSDKKAARRAIDLIYDYLFEDGSETIDLDDLDYSIDVVNSVVPKIARKYGFERL